MTLEKRGLEKEKKVAERRDIPDTEKLASSGTQGDVGAGKVVHRSF